MSWGNLPVPPDPFHRSASRTERFAFGQKAYDFVDAFPSIASGVPPI
jgi:hypothetical protein